MLVHNQLVQAFAVPGMVPQKIKVGVIGCGDRGRGLIQVMNDLPENFEVVAVCDVLDFRIAETRKLPSFKNWKVYKDHRKLLEDKNVQAVAIATPLNMHFSIASDSLAAGKHVYLEKTMTYSIPQALEMVKTTAKYPGQVLQVGHQYRYTPLYYKVKEMIAKGYLGTVTQIDCRWDRNASWRRPVPEAGLERQVNWRMYKEYSGGLAAELLSHQIDFINWAFGTHPDEILATGGIDHYKDGRETFDNMQVMMRYNKPGMIGNFGATCANERDGYLFKLKGQKGTVSLLIDEGVYYPEKEARKELETVDGVARATKITWNKEGGIPILTEPTKDGTWYALKDFYKSVVTKKQPASNVLTGATTAFCVHLANQAAYTNTIQKWKVEYDV